MTDDDIEIRARDLRVGDLVDLQSCPFLNDELSAEFELATVYAVEPDPFGFVVVSYEGIPRAVAYEPSRVLRGRLRPAGIDYGD